MDRAATVIALVVVLFVAAVVGVLIVRGQRAPAPRQEAAPSKADQEIKQIHIQEEAKGGSYRWSLDAEQAEILPGTGKTLLQKVTIGVDEAGRRWKVTSDEGDITQDTRDVELRGKVVLVSSEGLRVETSVLRWNNTEGRAWTDQPVTIYKGGGVVKGSGLDVKPSEEITLVHGRVTATFGGSKGPVVPAPARLAPVRPTPARKGTP